jgi:hypothetical protein
MRSAKDSVEAEGTVEVETDVQLITIELHRLAELPTSPKLGISTPSLDDYYTSHWYKTLTFLTMFLSFLITVFVLLIISIGFNAFDAIRALIVGIIITLSFVACSYALIMLTATEMLDPKQRGRRTVRWISRGCVLMAVLTTGIMVATPGLGLIIFQKTSSTSRKLGSQEYWLMSLFEASFMVALLVIYILLCIGVCLVQRVRDWGTEAIGRRRRRR